MRRWSPAAHILALGLLAFLGAAIAGACGSTQPRATPGIVKVVAGENMWGSIVAQIGGRHVSVTSLITSPNADPHLYESSAADAASVAEAGLVVANGAGDDTWLSQLLAATSHPGRIVVTVSHVLNKTGTNVNPHFWYDIPVIPKVAAAIETALARIDPGNARSFAAGLARFDRSLVPIDAVISQLRSRYSGAPVAYTERVPGYLLAAAGLSVKTPASFAASIEDGSSPSPADTAAMDALITGRKIRLLLYNAQVVSAVTTHVRALARKAGIPVVAVTETLPPSFPTYQSWQLAQAQAILRALGT